MYRNQHKWIQLALLFFDWIISALSLLIAGILRFKSYQVFSATTDFSDLIIILAIASFSSYFICQMYRNFFIRGYLRELIHICSYNFLVMLNIALFIFVLKNTTALSRLTLLYFIIINTVLMYAFHIMIKKIGIWHGRGQKGWKLLIISDSKNLATACKNVQNSAWKDRAIGVVCLDDDRIAADSINNIPLIAPENSIPEHIIHNAIDEVLLSVSEDRYYTDEIQALRDEMVQTGIIFSIKIWPIVQGEPYVVKLLTFGDEYVLSFANRTYEYILILLKRLMDIVGGIVGSILTLLLGILIVPAILIESPGPVFFKQKRVGRNGRIFTILKFRSMYRDAEERKKELLAKNKMKGLLFKMDDDPRITKVGKFIRKTSLDELPQFFNVLSGDMSLVGTRPPTLDEYQHYTSAYKKRLSFRPGITGIWQTSGRNDITDFDNVLHMDLEYIQNWSIYLDIKLIIKTVLVVLSRKGAE